MIADTNYIIDVLSKKEDAITKSLELTQKTQAQNLCTPVIYELMTGIILAGSKREKIKFESIIEKSFIYPYDLKAARLSGEIHAELLQAGEERGSLDIQIASIALANDEVLLTNDSDFDVISELFDLKIERH